MSNATNLIGKAAGKRLSGDRPGVLQSLGAAAVVGFAAAGLTYRLLRSGSN